MTELCLQNGLDTLNYMAPEIIRSFSSNYTNKIDIWSFGCVLYEIITSNRLFKSKKAQLIIDISNFEDFNAKFDEMSPMFQKILRKSILKNPDHRYGAKLLIELLVSFFFLNINNFIS
jgi:serine/threonine protein kinase